MSQLCIIIIIHFSPSSSHIAYFFCPIIKSKTSHTFILFLLILKHLNKTNPIKTITKTNPF